MEAKNIYHLIPKIHEVLVRNGINNYITVIVDDNSPDGTAKIALLLSKKYPVKVIVRRNKRGLYSAIVEGVKSINCKYIVCMDADGQHPPEVIPIMYKLALSKGYDLIIASRFIPLASAKGLSIFRKIISRLATYFTWSLIPSLRGIYDLQSGFFLVKRNYIVNLNITRRSWKILLDLIMLINERSKIIEIPYHFKKRFFGKSKFSPIQIIYYIIQVLQISLNYRILRSN